MLESVLSITAILLSAASQMKNHLVLTDCTRTDGLASYLFRNALACAGMREWQWRVGLWSRFKMVCNFVTFLNLAYFDQKETFARMCATSQRRETRLWCRLLPSVSFSLHSTHHWLRLSGSTVHHGGSDDESLIKQKRNGPVAPCLYTCLCLHCNFGIGQLGVWIKQVSARARTGDLSRVRRTW